MPRINRVLDNLTDLNGVPADIGAEDLNNKGIPNGYASLDASGYISAEQMQFTVELWDSEL